MHAKLEMEKKIYLNEYMQGLSVTGEYENGFGSHGDRDRVPI